MSAPVPPAMTLDGVDPPLPRELVDAMTPYLSHRGAASVGWSPPLRVATASALDADDRSAPTLLVLTRFGESSQLHAVARPGGSRRQLTFSREPISWGAYSPRNTGGERDFLAFAADRGGDESTQLYRLDLAPSPQAGRVTLLTDGDYAAESKGGADGDKSATAKPRARNTSFRFSRDGRFLAYCSTRRNGRDTDLWIMEPERAHESPRPAAFDRLVLQLDGGGWWVCDFSHGDRWLLIGRYVSVNETHLWRVDLAPLRNREEKGSGSSGGSPRNGPESDGKGRDEVASLSLEKFPVTPVAATATLTTATTDTEINTTTITASSSATSSATSSGASVVDASDSEEFAANAYVSPPEFFLPSRPSPSGSAETKSAVAAAARSPSPVPTAPETVYYGSAHFAADGRVYATTDRDSDFRRLVVLTPPPSSSSSNSGDASWRHDYPLPDLAWDVSDTAMSPDGALLAYTVNEDGFSRLHVLRLPSHEPIALPSPAAATATVGDERSVPTGDGQRNNSSAGVITNLVWHPTRHTLAFSLSSARCSLDAYTVDVPDARGAALQVAALASPTLPPLDALGCRHAPKSINLFAHLPALADVACVCCYYGAYRGAGPATHCSECRELSTRALAASAANTGASTTKSSESVAAPDPAVQSPPCAPQSPPPLPVRWTESETGGLDASRFSAPSTLRVASFDGLVVSGNLYRPDARRWPGRRPLVIAIHGGPEAQARPSYQGSWNYFLEELGYILLFPNVRGSTGYGKRFVTLDDGMRRQDSVRDIGAFIDWARRDFEQHMSASAASRDVDSDRDRDGDDAKQEAKTPTASSPPPAVAYCDPDAVMLYGGSYGGYMVLATMVAYPLRVRCGVDMVGISNWVTFLENTQPYRRALRRVEYGDERDPEMRAYLHRISPLTQVASIRCPLLVLQGANDPRVPRSESDQMVRALRARKDGGGDDANTVWYAVADDEGHGFAKRSNSEYAIALRAHFFRHCLAVTVADR